LLFSGEFWFLRRDPMGLQWSLWKETATPTARCWCLLECAIRLVLQILEQAQIGFSCHHRKELLLPEWRNVAMVTMTGKTRRQKRKSPSSPLQPSNLPKVQGPTGNFWQCTCAL
jgi:hypothetical protein